MGGRSTRGHGWDKKDQIKVGQQESNLTQANHNYQQTAKYCNNLLI